MRSDAAEAVGGDDNFAGLDGGGERSVNPFHGRFCAFRDVEQFENFLIKVVLFDIDGRFDCAFCGGDDLVGMHFCQIAGNARVARAESRNGLIDVKDFAKIFLPLRLV